MDNTIAYAALILLFALGGFFMGHGIARQRTENAICSYHCTQVHGENPDAVKWKDDACQCKYTYGEPK